MVKIREDDNVSGETMMEKKVHDFIKKHELLHPGARVMVGVSGGPDSMALLYYLKKISKKWKLDLHVLSVEHGMRGDDSVDDFHYVKEVASLWQIPFHGTFVQSGAYAKKNRVSLEVAARELRYQFFTEKMNELQADYLALGHHGDDQVETLLMKLVRTASSTAFLGIPVTRPIGKGKIIRPLLSVTKEEIESYCDYNNINPRIDATNLESTHTRNYYRHHLVPLLKEKNSNIHQTAQHLSETLTEDEAYLQKQAKRVVEESVSFQEKKGRLTLNIDLFKKHAQPLQRRAFHLLLNYLYEKRPDHLSYIHEEQFLDLIKERSGNRKIDFPHGLTLNRTYELLNMYFDQDVPQKEAYQIELSVPGTTNLPNGSRIIATYTSIKEKESPSTFYLASDELNFPLHVRTRKNGDRMTWKGLEGTKKLKDIFIDSKVPLEKRKTWPILTDASGQILWLVGLRKGLQSKTSQKQFLYLEFKHADQ